MMLRPRLENLLKCLITNPLVRKIPLIQDTDTGGADLGITLSIPHHVEAMAMDIMARDLLMQNKILRWTLKDRTLF